MSPLQGLWLPLSWVHATDWTGLPEHEQEGGESSCSDSISARKATENQPTRQKVQDRASGWNMD